MKLTRRSAIRQGGLLSAGVALGAGQSTPASAAGDVIRVGDLSRGAAVMLQLPPGPHMLAAQWSAPARGAELALRIERPGGTWSGWAQAGVLHGGDRGARLAGEPIWIGEARRAQLRAGSGVREVQVHLLALGEAVASVAAVPLEVLDAGPGQPAIVPRSAWGAGAAAPGRLPAFSEVQMAFVHHTQSLNGYSRGQVPGMLRAIEQFHRGVRGWKDVGYNFLIDRFGRIFEGRAGGVSQPVVGAQAGGFNLQSTGVAVLGSFSGARPPAAAARALAHLLAWKLALHGLPVQGRAHVRVDPAGAAYARFPAGARVQLPRVAGHRDGCSTDCPGRALYRELPALRRAAAVLAGAPASLALLDPGVPLPAGAGELRGQLLGAAGVPIGGAPIELRVRGGSGAELLLARATTGADGSFAGTISLQRNASIRAVHVPAPARVSPAVDLAVAPVLTLSASSPGQLSGTVRPAKSSVLLSVYSAGASGALTRVAGPLPVAVAADGTFAAAVPPLGGSGPFAAGVHTPADALNAAGSSPLLAL